MEGRRRRKERRRQMSEKEKTPEVPAQEPMLKALCIRVARLEKDLRHLRTYTFVLNLLICLGALLWNDRFRVFVGLVNSILQGR